MKLTHPAVAFGVRYSLFDLPAVPVNRFHVELPALNWHGFRSGTKHFAGQAGILRFALELLCSLHRSYRLRFYFLILVILVPCRPSPAISPS